MRQPPYPTVLKPYGTALVELAKQRPEVVCLSADLTRQCEVDLFRDTIPERFINGGMAEQNLMGIAGALAREGHIPFVHSFGVFCTRRPYDQVAMAIAYPDLPVRIVGFMPGLSSPGGPSHQAIDDVALMRALPNMTVVDVADAVEVSQVVPAIADLPGPVYLRLKRGEIPVIFDDGDHVLKLDSAQVLSTGRDVAIVSGGMMLPAALVAASVLAEQDVEASVLNVPVIKPLDATTVLDACASARAVVVAENHSVIGGLGSAVAEALAEAGLGRPLRRVGVQDVFAGGSCTASYLFERYGLSARAVIEAAWTVTASQGPPPAPPPLPAEAGTYAPV
jgi:transketolase